MASILPGAAYTVGVAWLAFDKVLQSVAINRFGCNLVSGGTPRWQCWTKLWTQLLVMPGIFCLSYAQHGFSMHRWSEVAETVLFSTDGTRWYDWAFGYVFGAYLLEDLFNESIDALLIWHHVGCMLGHLVAFVLLPSGFPYYFGGAVALEFGSALYNLYCLYPSARGMAWAFLLSMTLSNMVAACFCIVWLRRDFPLHAKVFSGVVTSIFIIIRQKEAMSEVRAATATSKLVEERSAPHARAKSARTDKVE